MCEFVNRYPQSPLEGVESTTAKGAGGCESPNMGAEVPCKATHVQSRASSPAQATEVLLLVIHYHLAKTKASPKFPTPHQRMLLIQWALNCDHENMKCQ